MTRDVSRPETDFDGPEDFLDYLESLFSGHASESYGDRLSVAAHMLQTAAVAAGTYARDSLVAASLLHDIGHWLNQIDGRASGGDHERDHDIVGARYLEPFFGPEVTRCIALHVAAKRYLCAREPDYFTALSIASTRSLELQGGPMSVAEAAHFETLPEYSSAVALRRWDEYGKVPGLTVPEFSYYRPLLKKLLRPWPAA